MRVSIINSIIFNITPHVISFEMLGLGINDGYRLAQKIGNALLRCNEGEYY